MQFTCCQDDGLARLLEQHFHAGIGLVQQLETFHELIDITCTQQ